MYFPVAENNSKSLASDNLSFEKNRPANTEVSVKYDEL
jgi:hypothetical protein